MPTRREPVESDVEREPVERDQVAEDGPSPEGPSPEAVQAQAYTVSQLHDYGRLLVGQPGWVVRAALKSGGFSEAEFHALEDVKAHVAAHLKRPIEPVPLPQRAI